LSAIARLAGFARWTPRPALDSVASRGHLAGLLAAGERPTIHEHDAKGVLSDYGVPVTRERLAATMAEARRAAAGIGFPVVLKAVSDHAAHKSDLGLVELGIVDEVALERAWNRLTDRIARSGIDPAGVLVQEMVAGGVEVLVGVSRDADFGLTLALGPGGVAADLSGGADVGLRVLPLRAGDAAAMISESPRLSRQLGGFRQSPRADVDALVDCIEALARFAWAERDHITEIDLNPVVVLSEGEGCSVVDALIVPEMDRDEEESHG
jgi:hypothetical protein